MAIRAFLFDLGNVLVHFSHERMYDQMGAVIGRPAARVRDFVESSGLMDLYDRGRIDDETFASAAETWLGRPLDRAAFSLAVADIFEIHQPMVDAARSLKDQGYRLVLISNTCSVHIEWVRRQWRVLDIFDDLVLSYEVGSLKPEREIFESAVRLARCDARECFYTDDIPEYVEAARQFGIDAELFVCVERFWEQMDRRGVRRR